MNISTIASSSPSTRRGTGAWTLCALALSLASSAPPGLAQSTPEEAPNRRPRFFLDEGGDRKPVDVTRSPRLLRPVTLSLRGVPLRQAIAEVSRQSGLAIVFSNDVVASDAEVDLRARRTAVAAVLSDLLAGRGVDVVFRPDGSAALVPLPAPQQPAQGTVSGKVTDATTGRPIELVTVSVEGTSIAATTGNDGAYRLGGVAPGPQTILARRIGYIPRRLAVTVTAGQDATLDFQLAPAPTVLEAVVTTATGRQRRIELGNTVELLDVQSRIETAPVKSIGELLNAQATGVHVQIGNATGVTSRVRIRGLSSMTLSNDPIYIIDGIRMTNTVGGAGTGGGSIPSRVNDLDPAEIQNIEVVKGPSAATLYGTDAANGVIVITTRRGRAGPTAWSVNGEQGILEDRNPYLAQYSLLGKSPGSTTQRRCLTTELAVGACVLDSATVLNIWKDPDLTPLQTGYRSTIGGNVSGGTDAFRYFLSANAQIEDGPMGLPRFDRRRFDSLGVRITPNMERPSHLEQYAFRANLNTAVSPRLDLAVSTGLTKGAVRFPQNDNNTNGVMYNAVAGPGYVRGPGYTGIGVLGEELRGYALMTPGQIFQRLSQQTINRFVASTTANWRPLDWLVVNADVGIDHTDRRDVQLQRLGEGPTTGTQLQGFASDGRTRLQNFTTNLLATARWNASRSVQLRTTAGAQYVSFDLNSVTATGTQLAPGAEAPSQAAVYSVAASSSPSKTFGAFVEEQVAIRDRLYLTGAVRTDRNSAFGVNYKNAYYPKLALSWLLSEEPFLPEIPQLTQLRLRASFGSSGVQPGPTAALKTYTASAVHFQGQTASGLTLANPGNADLRPEKSTEFEAGIDSRWWNDRVTFELTYYRKRTKDALILQPVAPSAGVSSFLANLGGMRNAGWEYRLHVQLLEGRNVGWEIAFSGSHNDNLVTALGNIITTPTSSIQVGRPVYSVFQRKISYNDANNDGLLSNAEVTVSDPTDVEYLGPATAPTQMTLSTGLELFGRRLRISALADRKAGGRQTNLERMLPCLVGTSCPELQQLNLPLASQARGVALRRGVFAGYSEDTDFIKLREVAATYDFGSRLARRILGARSARMTLAARNLKIWSDWTGSDPEAFIANNVDAPGGTSGNIFTVAAPRHLAIRLSLGY